ncbi:MAG: hypothetical protein IPM83_16635 [Ignavibacteria bacterium]|nr:hypothetical protein [Ignavibacteria bacterium]
MSRSISADKPWGLAHLCWSEFAVVTRPTPIPPIKAAMNHKGFAFLNVISPCVTFNNNVGSTKSYDFKSVSTWPPPRPWTSCHYVDRDHGHLRRRTDAAITPSRWFTQPSAQACRRLEDHAKMSAIQASSTCAQRSKGSRGSSHYGPTDTELHHVLNTSDRP